MLAVAGRIGGGVECTATCRADIDGLEIYFDWTPGDPNTGTSQGFDIHEVLDTRGRSVNLPEREIIKKLIQYKQKAA